MRAIASILLASPLIVLLAATSPLRAQGAAPPALPPGDARDMVSVACSQCHALRVLTTVREAPAGWRRHVYNMVLRGAQLNPRETEAAIQYLAANFGPGAPQAGEPKKIALPAGAGKELVETRCAACHDLERVTIVKRQKSHWPTVVANMVARGAVATPEEAKSMSAYLTAHFGGD